jgi:GntR family transcriptional repressor for pyruvate dehydrogenase complex
VTDSVELILSQRRPAFEVRDMSKSNHLSPIKAVPAYTLVAEQIQRAVHMGLLVPGDRLPPERALAEQLGVARLTVREAIRVLTHDGLITVRRGARGGMWIRAQEVAKEEVLRIAATADRAMGDVYEYREIIERATARLAAERAKPQDIRKLRRLTRAMKAILRANADNPLPSHVSQFLAIDSQFHTEIARISANPFLAEAMERILASRHALYGALFRALTPNANEGHDELVNAIAEADGAHAERIMAAHIGSSRSWLLAVLKRHVRAQTR